jgi:hypothetical protein
MSEVLATAVSVPLFYLAAQRDVHTVAVVQIVSVGLYGLFRMTQLRQVIDLTWWHAIRPLGTSLVASLVMLGALILTVSLLEPLGAGWSVVLNVLIGAATYGLAIWKLDAFAIRRVANLLRPRRTVSAEAVS